MSELISREEAAVLLGVKPESVRKTLSRYGITEQRGYDRAAVEALERPGRGWRAGQRSEPQPPETEQESTDG